MPGGRGDRGNGGDRRDRRDGTGGRDRRDRGGGSGWCDRRALIVEVKVIDDATTLTTGDGKIIICIPLALNGREPDRGRGLRHDRLLLRDPDGADPERHDSVEMLTTKLTIDASETTSYTAATAAVIDAAHKDVATGDLIAVDVAAAGTGAKGLGTILTFA